MKLPSWVYKIAAPVLMLLASILTWAVRQEGRINALEQARAVLQQENQQQNEYILKLVLLQVAPGSRVNWTRGKSR